jgi:zinc transport system ATP-binding protein
MSEERSGPVIVMEDVSFSYDFEPVLQSVSFAIDPGEVVSVVGPNGGGKSTLLKLMLGLVRPTRGKVEVLGCPPEKVSRQIGYVPQNAQFDFRFPVDVTDVVLMGRLGSGALGPFRRQDRQMARDALRQVGLYDLRHRHFSALSGGQRQRVLIARALAARGQILLMDEPTSDIDREAEKEIYALLRELGRTHTIVLVSHDLGVVTSLTSKVLCVNRSLAIHPAVDLTGEMIKRLYAGEVAIVDHATVVPSGAHPDA